MVDLAVQHLEADRHAGVLGRLLDPVQADDAVVQALLEVHAAPVAEERDDVGDAGLGRLGDAGFQALDDGVVVLGVVEAVGDRPAPRIGHRAEEAVRLQRVPFVFLQEVDGGQPHVLHRGGEVGKRDLLVAPPRHRLLQPALGHHAPRGGRRRVVRSRGVNPRSLVELGGLSGPPRPPRSRCVNGHERSRSGQARAEDRLPAADGTHVVLLHAVG